MFPSFLTVDYNTHTSISVHWDWCLQPLFIVKELPSTAYCDILHQNSIFAHNMSSESVKPKQTLSIAKSALLACKDDFPRTKALSEEQFNKLNMQQVKFLMVEWHRPETNKIVTGAIFMILLQASTQHQPLFLKFSRN